MAELYVTIFGSTFPQEQTVEERLVGLWGLGCLEPSYSEADFLETPAKKSIWAALSAGFSEVRHSTTLNPKPETLNPEP